MERVHKLRQYVENLSAYGDAMLNLSKLYPLQGDPERAKEINDQLLAVSPERLDAQMNGQLIDTAMGRAPASPAGEETAEGSGD